MDSGFEPIFAINQTALSGNKARSAQHDGWALLYHMHTRTYERRGGTMK